MPIRNCAIAAAALASLFVRVAPADTVFYGPTHYFSQADSPFNLNQLGTNFWLETFEDGLLNTPGVSAVNGAVRGPSSLTDSVDADDGVIDGHGNGGHSYLVRPGSLGVTFNFSAQALGAYPLYGGIVITDGYGVNGAPQATAEFYDENGNLIGTLNSWFQDFNVNTTDDDWFLGVYNSSGISKIHISTLGTGNSGLEVDHLQYGFPVPEASTLVLAVAAAVSLGVAQFARRASQTCSKRVLVIATLLYGFAASR